jgi:transcriptional regulator with XRE-family HTH domain
VGEETTTGEWVLTLREARGWSQTELADRLQAETLRRGRPRNTSQQTVSYWETKGREPSRDYLIALASVFGVDEGDALALPVGPARRYVVAGVGQPARSRRRQEDQLDELVQRVDQIERLVRQFIEDGPSRPREGRG